MQINSPELWLDKFPYALDEDNKYSRGFVVVNGGGIECTGAAKLAATAALRIGAGLVSVICDNLSLPSYAASLTSVMTATANNLAEFREYISDKRRNTIIIGPGNGINEFTRSRTLLALELDKNLVIDADAISAFEHDPEQLFNAIINSGGEVVITPHEGEFKRIFRHIDSHLPKPERAKLAATECGAVVVFKGHETAIASPDGRLVINNSAPATLATAGSGDVLAGIIGGLLAQGMSGFDAASAATWIHGECAKAFGIGLISEDLPQQIPHVLQKLFKPL